MIDEKLEVAKAFGITHAVNPKTIDLGGKKLQVDNFYL